MRRQSPLHEWHGEIGASLGEENGAFVPMTYGEADEEYRALRARGGLMDLSHEARFRVSGDNALGFLDAILTTGLGEGDPGSVHCGYLLNERGGIIDLLEVVLEESCAVLLGSGVLRASTFAWLTQRAAEAGDVVVEDLREETGLLAVLGAAAPVVVGDLPGADGAPPPGRAANSFISGYPTLVIRRTTDDLPAILLQTERQATLSVWKALLRAGVDHQVRPVGQQALRFHCHDLGIPRIGVDTTQDMTPLEINDEPRVDFRKRRFAGKRALMHSTSSEFGRSLVVLRVMTREEIPEGSEVVASLLPVGRITSSARVPGSGTLAFAYISSLKARIGTPLTVRTSRGDSHQGEVIKLPFAYRTES